MIVNALKSHCRTRSDNGHSQWRQAGYWWRHITPVNWSSSTHKARNSGKFVCWATCHTHVMRWSHWLEHLSSVTTTHNWSRLVKSHEVQVLYQFSDSSFGRLWHTAADSQGSIIIADYDNHRILLLDTQLALRCVIIDKHQLNYKKPVSVLHGTGRTTAGRTRVWRRTVFDVIQRQTVVHMWLCVVTVHSHSSGQTALQSIAVVGRAKEVHDVGGMA